MDFLAANHLGRAMYADLSANPDKPPNFARYAFLDAAARRFYPDWNAAADTPSPSLRTAAGRDPHDKGLHDLVGELSTRSDEFRRRWGAHDVRTTAPASSASTTGRRRPRPRLREHRHDLRTRPHLTIYATEPASPTARALALLGSWAATPTPLRQFSRPDRRPIRDQGSDPAEPTAASHDCPTSGG